MQSFLEVMREEIEEVETLEAAIAAFAAVGMPAKNFAERIRREYANDCASWRPSSQSRGLSNSTKWVYVNGRPTWTS